MTLRSPYLLFVQLLARCLDGEYPAHYDTGVRRRVRAILLLGSLLSVVFAIHAQPASRPLATLSAASVTTAEFVTALLLLGVTIGIWRAAYLRRKSIEKHVLTTTTEELVTDDSAEAAEDAVLLFDYLKVFFALALLFHIPDILMLVWPTYNVLFRVSLALYAFQMYYMLIFIDYAIYLGGRWGRDYLLNDRDTTTQPQSNS